MGILLYSIIRHYTILYYALSFSIILFSTTIYSAILDYIVLYDTLLYAALLYSPILLLHSNILCYITPYILFCNFHYHLILHSIPIYYTKHDYTLLEYMVIYSIILNAYYILFDYIVYLAILYYILYCDLRCSIIQYCIIP